jgi:hypothetical protein
MTYWFADYHHMLPLRILSLAVGFGVLWPALGLLLAGIRWASHIARQIWYDTRTWHRRVL